MAKALGSSKTGGRAKGTTNKDKQALAERAKALGVDPFQILLLFAAGNWKALGYPEEFDHKSTKDGMVSVRVISADLRGKCASEACQYIHPKKKAIEHTGEVNLTPTITVIKRANGEEHHLGMKEKEEG